MALVSGWLLDYAKNQQQFNNFRQKSFGRGCWRL